MNIIVCIKQVPETSNVRLDERTGTMIREGVESIINPLDLYAIEEALQLREMRGGRVTVISMGPPSAGKALRESLAMGCDDAVLISDRAFAGSDTYATSYALSQAVTKLAPFDLVLTGERATDGDTGQVGPGIASFLDLPLATYVSRISAVKAGSIIVERLIEEGYERARLPLPCLITVVKAINYPRLPTLRGKLRAKAVVLPTWGPADLHADPQRIGLDGSPTRVVEIERPAVARKGRIIDLAKVGAKHAAKELADFLEERNLL